MHRFRTPELFLGCFLTVAIFATGMLFAGGRVDADHPAQSNSPQESEKPASDKSGPKPFWESAATDPVAAFTLGLVFVGLFQAGLFFVQLGFMRKGMEDATVAAKAARDGALAARDSADVSKLAMTAGERAYVHHAGCRWISHTSRIDDSIFWRIRPLWTNAGNTPARKTRVYVHYELLDHVLPDDYAFRPDDVPDIDGMIAAKTLIESGPRDVSGADLKEVSEGRKHLYIWGTARYIDVFPGTPERITKFCVFATNITGDPLVPFDQASNQVDIAFQGYPRHNCMDEDC